MKRTNPSPFRVGARVQDEYGNLGTVEVVPRSRGGAYHVRMDPTRAAGVGSFANVVLMTRSEMKGAGKPAGRKRNPDTYFKAPPPDAHPAYKGSEFMDYEWWVKHYAPESVREERRAKELAAYNAKYPPKPRTAAQEREDAAWEARATRAEARDWTPPRVKAPGRKRNPAPSHYNVVTQACPPGGSWRAENVHGPYADIDTAKRKAMDEADEYADVKSDWKYRSAVYPSDAFGDSLTTRPAATVYPSKARAAARHKRYLIAIAKRDHDWDAVAKLEKWGKARR
jgi:hypothetical protein